MSKTRGSWLGTSVWIAISLVIAGCAPLALPAGTAMPTQRAIVTQPPTGYPAPSEPVPTITSSPEPNWGATLEVRLTSEPIPTVARIIGICDCVDTGLAQMGYDLKNSWQMQIGGVWTHVQAGASASDPQQGIVIVTREIQNSISGGFYNTPTKSGAVRIVSEQNNRLTLQTDSGQVYYFDVPGQTFMPSLTQVAPTVTPGPTFTLQPPTTLPPTGYPNLAQTAQPPVLP